MKQHRIKCYFILNGEWKEPWFLLITKAVKSQRNLLIYNAHKNNITTRVRLVLHCERRHDMIRFWAPPMSTWISLDHLNWIEFMRGRIWLVYECAPVKMCSCEVRPCKIYSHRVPVKIFSYRYTPVTCAPVKYFGQSGMTSQYLKTVLFYVGGGFLIWWKRNPVQKHRRCFLL